MNNISDNSIDCSIIILNYFGEKVIETTINSLLKLDFPKDKLEIIIVDNDSRDNSRKIIDKIIKKNKRLIRKVYLRENGGFAKGNNQGIKIARGKYIALLNNDCIVDKNWLKELLKKARSNNKIFSVGSKILLYPRYIDFYLPFVEGFYLKDVFVSRSEILKFSNDIKIKIPFNFLVTKYLIELPVIIEKDLNIELVLHFLNSNKLPLSEIKKSYSKLFKIKEAKKIKNNVVSLNCVIEKKQIKKYYDKVQNAGSIVFQDGYGRDIGAVVKYQNQNYEKDFGQFNKDKEVYSTCGAAVLYNRKILEKIGLLDETFFMYYEDTEISERARILGYKNYYCHGAIARHLHALSSKEWSPFFIFNVEKGRLLHVYYTFPLQIFLKEFVKFTVKSQYKLLKSIRNKKDFMNCWQNTRVILDLLFNFFKYQKNKMSKNLYKKNINNNYELITSGYWYFN